MNKDPNAEKQIEEMATIICQNTEFDTMWGECYQSADALYNEGYRKASEVTREIFAESHNMLLKMIRVVDDGLIEAIRNDDEAKKMVHSETKETLRCLILCLNELKKKYTEEEK